MSLMKTRRWIFLGLVWCALFMAATGATALIGHFLEWTTLYTWGSTQAAGMAINTSVLFIVGGMALLLLLILIDERYK